MGTTVTGIAAFLRYQDTAHAESVGEALPVQHQGAFHPALRFFEDCSSRDRPFLLSIRGLMSTI